MNPRREEAKRLRAQGMTFAQIGEALGVSRVRAFNLCRTPDPPSRIMPDDAVIVALYESGLTDADVAQEFGVSAHHVWRVRYRHGVQGHDRVSRLAPCDLERLLEMARAGLTYATIGAEFEISRAYARAICAKHGIRRRPARKATP